MRLPIAKAPEQHRLNMTRYTTSLNEKPEAELVGDARNANREAAAELFRRQYHHSIAVARRMLQAPEEFLDAVQSALSFCPSEISSRSAQRQA